MSFIIYDKMLVIKIKSYFMLSRTAISIMCVKVQRYCGSAIDHRIDLKQMNFKIKQFDTVRRKLEANRSG
jgi:hypothetical protein